MTYNICNKCYAPIKRNGVIAYKRRGRGYSKEGTMYHRGCINQINIMTEVHHKNLQTICQK